MRANEHRSDWVALGVFAQPHGVRGLVKIKSYTTPPDALLAHAQLHDAKGRSYVLKLHGHAKGMAIVSVEGIGAREEAMLLRGREIGTARAALPPLTHAHQFYISDLIGMSVEQTDAQAYGTVKAVHNFGAGDILEIVLSDGHTELFSFTHRTFPTVDLASRTLVIDPPETIE